MSEPAPKKRSGAKRGREPRRWLLLEFAIASEENSAYRVPIDAESACQLRRAVRQVVELQRGRDSELTAMFARAVVAILDGVDEEQLLLDYCVQDSQLDLRAARIPGTPLPADLAPIDLCKLRAERAQWEGVAGSAADYVVRLADASDEPADLYQVLVLDCR